MEKAPLKHNRHKENDQYKGARYGGSSSTRRLCLSEFIT